MKKFVILLIMLAGTPVLATIHFNDGNYHLIDYIIDDSVHIDEGMSGVGTHIEVSASGGIAPGESYGYISAYGDSRVTISGGELGWTLWCNENSRATVKEGAYFRGSLSVGGNAIAAFEDSSVNSVVTKDNGSLDIISGIIRVSLELRDNANVFWAGGTVGSHIMSGGTSSTDDTCLLTISGSSLAVNGTPLEYGEFVSDFALSGTITGTLLNGDIINNNFSILGDSDIVFVPEPGMLLLVGLGGLLLRRKAKPKSEALNPKQIKKI